MCDITLHEVGRQKAVKLPQLGKNVSFKSYLKKNFIVLRQITKQCLTLLLNMARGRIMAGYSQNSFFKALVGAYNWVCRLLFKCNLRGATAHCRHSWKNNNWQITLILSTNIFIFLHFSLVTCSFLQIAISPIIFKYLFECEDKDVLTSYRSYLTTPLQRFNPFFHEYLC